MPTLPDSLLVESVSPTGCVIKNLPQRIWVFGGVRGEKGKPAQSLRDAFLRGALSGTPKPWYRDLDWPENYPEWWAFSGYRDLLEFEREACFLARKVILFSESPGSHAELGAFALDDSILPRLIVVVQAQFLQEDSRKSFLNLGPLERVRAKGRECVLLSDDTKSLDSESFLAICETVEATLADQRHASESFRPDDKTHQLLLLADLVDLFLVSKSPDLHKALLHFGVQLSESALLSKLTLLAFLGMTREVRFGHESFWVRHTDSDAPWLDYTSANLSAPFDRSRFKARAQELVRDNRRRNHILEATP